MPVAGGRTDAAGGGAPTGPAGGDLDGTYPDPTVIAWQTTDGPTRLALGAILDGQVPQRSGTDVIGFDAIGGPNSAWEEDAGDDLLPKVDLVGNLGSDAQRIERIRARSAAIVGGAGSPTFAAGQGGLIAGHMAGAGGTEALEMGGAFTPAVAMLGKVTAYPGATARIKNPGASATVIGTGFSSGAGALAYVHSGPYAYGSFTGGYTFAGGAGGVAEVYGYGTGSFTFGYVSSGAGTSYVKAAGTGSIAMGSISGGGTNKILSSGFASFAQGHVSNTTASPATIQATRTGALARGGIYGAGLIEATEAGAVAMGYTIGASVIRASARGSFAFGYPIAGAVVEATAIGAVQFGVGSNSRVNSLQIGSAGLRFNGTTGTPVLPVDGEFWVAAGYVYIRSSGVSVKIT